MAKINIGGSPSYTIPLDSFDLAFLGKYVQTPRAEKMPLWSNKRLNGESEYCQVQIVTRDNNNEDCYSEASDTYQCHICNINVPKMCYQKHNESYQHETVKKIYQKVLERVSKQIDVNSMNTDEDIDQDLYYCEPCSKIIKIENKHNHEATECHTKSVKDLTIINEFYKILNENISFDVNEEQLGEEIEPFNSNRNYDACDLNIEASSSIDSDDSDSIINVPPPPGHSIIETKNQSPNEEKKQSFEEYLKEMIVKYNLKVTLPVVDGDFITIVAPNGDKVKVSREHFHGYTMMINSMWCQLCDVLISDDTRSHDVTEEHVRNIFRPINVQFARWVDNGWFSSHCVPCNERVLGDLDPHFLNDKHKKIIEDTQITDKTLCEDCNLYIDTHNFSVHLNSEIHLNVLMKQNCIQDTGNKDAVFCKICNLTLPKYALKFHIATKQHLATKTNGSTVLSYKNNDTTINNNKNKNNASTVINDKKNESLVTGLKVTEARFCKVCKVKVPSGGMKIHVNGRPHQNIVAQLSSANKKAVKPHQYRVEIDAKPSTSANTGSSASTFRMIDSVASTSTSSLSYYDIESDQEAEKIDAYYDMTEFVDETRTKVRCKICSVNIFFVERYIIEHMEGRNHIENANKQKMEVYKKFLFYADIEKTKLRCQICDVYIPGVERNIIEHMEERNHEIAENELLKFHLITRESSEFICECCNIRTKDYIEHMNSKIHTLEFLAKYKIDKNEMRKYVYEDKVVETVEQRKICSYFEIEYNIIES